LSQDESNTLATHLDAALTALHERLSGVLAHARELAPALGSVRTAEDAVQAGPDAVNAYAAARDLLRQYTEIRQTQRSLTVYGWHERTRAVDVLRIAGEFTDLDAVWPCWAKALTGNGYLDKVNNTYTVPPWPDDADPFEPRYTLAYLLWVADPGNAKAWVPTRAQLGEAFNKAYAAVDRRERDAEQASGRGYVPSEYIPAQV
jgi:hypothetical protein